MKKFLLVVLALIIALSVVACGDEEKSSDKKESSGSSKVEDGYVIKGSENEVDLGEPEDELDPEDVYEDLEYTPEMFYGNYRLLGGEEARVKKAKEVGFVDFVDYYNTGKTKSRALLPFQIRAGEQSLSNRVNDIEGYNWMELSFMLEDSEYFTSMYCAYTIEDNVIKFKPLADHEVDTESKKISYTFAEEEFEYEFEFNGFELTLSTEDKSVTLKTALTASEDDFYLGVSCCLTPGSDSIDDIDYISFMVEDDDSRLVYAVEEYDYKYDAICKFQDNGLFTLTIPWADGTETYQYVYFYCGSDGLVLTDGEDTYYYNLDYLSRNKANLKEYISEEVDLDSLSESEIKEIIEKKTNLFKELEAAFKKEGINVSINEQSGEIALDSTVLFEVGKYDLSDKGKDFLNKFVNVYSSVVFDEKYDGFISEILVEGHTDTTGDYDMNLQLSKDRANSVKNYCLSAEAGVDEAYASILKDTLRAEGYSYDKPVYDADGNVDLAASRRVSFRFLIDMSKYN